MPLRTYILAVFATCTVMHAAPVINWTERTGDTPVSGLTTASPTLGDGTADSADSMSIYATIPTVTLTNVGDAVTLSGSATLSGIDGSTNQFRWALYDVNGSGDDTGWLGYIGSQGHSSLGANLLERADPNTSWYMSSTGGGASTIDTAASPGTDFTDGTYNFLLTLERTAGGIQIDSSLIRTSDSQQFGLHSFEDTTPTYTFNRVGFLIGNNINADQVQFSNIDVSNLPAAPDTTPPMLVGKSPSDDATGVAVDTDIIATFDEAVTAGSGNITLKKTSGNVTVDSFNVATAPEVTFNGTNTVTIALSGDLDPLMDYHLLIDSTAIVDGSGNPFDGIATATVWNFTTLDPGTVVNPGTRIFGVEFNCNDAFSSPSQSLFRTVSGSTTQVENTDSYGKSIGAYGVTVSQPGSINLEFRGANGDGSRAIPGGDTSLSFLVADFIATREGAIDIGITGLAAGDYVFRSYHLDTFTGSALGYAQGATTTTPNTIEARIGGSALASVQPTSLGSPGLNTTFIDDGQIPTLEFTFSYDGVSPLAIELRSTVSNGTDNFLLLNGFELFESAP